MPLPEILAQRLSSATGRPFALAGVAEGAGGCINRTLVLKSHDGRRFFVKLNEAARLAMFEAEAEGLQELSKAEALCIPAPIASGTAEGQAFLILEHLDLVRGTPDTDERLGEGLAQLHRRTVPRFGWHRDNTIGSTLQRNPWNDDWIAFYRDQRLRYQLELAGSRWQTLGTELLERLPNFFAAYRPAPSLLHGDLWGGNVAVTRAGEPALFDPAVYFGDREADLAMTELFGGFSQRFYQAYRAAWPLDAGYSVRRTVYNLYHVLNHFNLFGGGYGTQAEDMMRELLSEVR